MLQTHPPVRVIFVALAISFATIPQPASLADQSAVPCRIEIIDKDTQWPVPLVELRTRHEMRFVSDNAGIIALSEPELMGRETWFSIIGHGYGVPRDGFGNSGVRLTPERGKTLRVEVNRTNIAKRLGRITGAGLFAESQKLDSKLISPESGVFGCDSVQNAVYRGKLFWLWGDSNVPHYLHGIFDSTGATSSLQPLASFEPPIRLEFDYFRNAQGKPRGIAAMPGSGPTWLSGLITLPDKSGAERLVATYMKIKPPLTVYQTGLCAWNEKNANFEHVRTLWNKSETDLEHPPMPTWHALIIDGEDGKKWAVFGNPFPTLRCPATFEAWQNPDIWERLKPQESLVSTTDGSVVKPHSGSIVWNQYRKRWITVFMQVFGKPSAFGEIWYAEADAPEGPWGPAVKILTHDNYTFYNPLIHTAFIEADSPILLFEGTFTEQFANHPEPSPRYDYNQIMYRLDLDDPKLAAAQGKPTINN